MNYSLLPKVLSTWFWTHPKASTLKCNTQKGPPSNFSPPLFSALWDFFSKSSKGPPSIFWCFATEWMLKKPKGPPFYIFRHYETVKNSHFAFFFNFQFFSKLFNVSEGSLFHFLKCCNKLDFQKAQRVPPLVILKTLRFLSLGYGAYFRRSRLVHFWFRQLTFGTFSF